MHRLLVTITILVLSGPAAQAGPWAPDVALKGNELVASPASTHRVTSASIEIVEADQCPAVAVPPRLVRLSGACGYLRGLYRYLNEGENGKPELHLVEFSVTRSGGGHALLVSDPIDLKSLP